MPREYSTLQKSILVVDEDQNLGRSLTLVLKRAGYQVATVSQAFEALEALRTGNYDLIILDIAAAENWLTLLPEVLCQYPRLLVLVLKKWGYTPTSRNRLLPSNCWIVWKLILKSTLNI
jgi:DNA-binding NtrC family response regulator